VDWSFVGVVSWILRSDVARLLLHNVVRIYRSQIAKTSPRFQVNEVSILSGRTKPRFDKLLVKINCIKCARKKLQLAN